jgi:hypothetical protein
MIPTKPTKFRFIWSSGFGSIYGRSSVKLLISSRSVNKHGHHRWFLFLIGWFFRFFSSETVWSNEPKKNRPIRNKNCLWRPCLLMDRDNMSNLYRGPSIDASYHVSLHLAERFQRRRLKCGKLTDDRWRTPSDGKSYDSCFWLADFLDSSPLKPFGQMNRNLVGSIYGKSSVTIAHSVPIR